MQIIINMGKGMEGRPPRILCGKCNFCILKNEPTVFYFRNALQLRHRRLAGSQYLLITVYKKVKCTFELWMVSP